MSKYVPLIGLSGTPWSSEVLSVPKSFQEPFDETEKVVPKNGWFYG